MTIESSKKILNMKKVFLGLFAFGLVQFCNAQTKEKSEVKFTPPAIAKDKPTSKPTKVKFTPPVIKKDEVVKIEKVKFAPPVVKKDHPVKKKDPVKFTPPVIVKDKTKKIN